MKILFPISTFYPVQEGGPNFTLFWHCKELVKNNIDVTIISTNTGFDSIKGELPPVNIFKSTDMGNIIYLSGRFKFLRQLYNVYSCLDKVDVIHLNSFFSPISFISFLMIKIFKNNKKIIWSTRGEMNTKALEFNSIQKKIVISFLKLFINKVKFHSTSDQETLDINKILKKKDIQQIPNLIEFDEKIIAKTTNNLLFIGRIHPIKCVENLISALSQSKLFKNSNFKLLIVGNCEERHKPYLNFLKKLIFELNLENKIEFKSHIKGAEKLNIYSSSKFTFLPSHSENFGNVVVESMSQGTPVVASKGTPWQDLNSFNAGFHVSNDSFSLAEIIDRIISMNDIEYNSYRKNCYNFAKQNFDISNRIEEWISIYKKS